MIFTLVGLLVVACLAAGFVFGRGSVRGATVAQEAPATEGADLSEMKVKKPKRLRRFFYWGGVFFVVAAIPLLMVDPAHATLSEAMRDSFSNELRNFVVGIMADSTNAVNQWSWMLFLFLAFLLVVREVVVFIANGFTVVSHAEAVIFFFATLAIMGGYSEFTDAIWGVGVGLGNGYQSALVGNTDNFFLSQWVSKSMSAVSLEDISIFDSIKLAIYFVLWHLIAMFLDVVTWIAGVWAHFGYALAKVIGMVFIPFLLLPSTRPLFDGWFKFLVGFVVLLIMLKATLVIAAISVKSILGTLGVTWTTEYGEPVGVVEVAKENFYLLADSSLMLFVAALFVLSSFAFAAALASGAGSPSGALGNLAKKAIHKLK
ncbi:hypothetical protein RE428_48870 (plasmid) [Marinobacter nanhaiticus D15-8W]|uniref:TrbL/VirB6 plasmid conjugal transfer protein n=1 Tax=Marinobacter nanhaiticus D15-8W TaxID=626887 RepID=N6X020_9GAMM|nr:type IV secretion system protein [Marinobacter nanhaiticus]ENO17141.1 hypothetical protein J057_00709 [Marinobacter nanhaiticus D15-8W]BES73869.1 hypothetical protein RE428_48870 [Marinobacter nanhaiticus D15-8W]